MAKVLMVGVGGMGSHHLECWRKMPDVQVAGICDVYPGRAQEKALDGEAVFTDMDDALVALPDIDLVDIAVPSYLHRALSCKALSHGLHTICEKPLALSYEDGKAIFDTARENGVCFMTAQVVRFMRPYAALREMIRDKRYGNVMRAAFRRLSGTPVWSWENWMLDEQKSGGVPFDLSIHDIDYIVSVFGMPDNITKHRATCSEEGYTDAYTVTMQYGAAQITAEAGWYNCAMPFCADFRVVCEKAVILYDGKQMTIYPRGHESVPVSVDLSAVHKSEVKGINLTSDDGYYEELSYFKECALNGKAPDFVPEKEVLAVLKLAEGKTDQPAF